MKHYSFPIDNDNHAHEIWHYIALCTSYHTTKWKNCSFIWIELR